MSTTLGRPPPGVEPDWSRTGYAPAIYGVCIAGLILNTLAVAARLYTRVRVLKCFGIDDCFCFLAYGMVTTQISFHFVLLQYGFGRHIYDIPAAYARPLYKNFEIIAIIPGIAYLFIKLTLLLTYARIFNPSKLMRWLIWGGVAVCTAFYVGDFFNELFHCHPIAKAWDPFLKGWCATESIGGGPTGIFNVISDTYIFLLPLPMVWSLNMNWKRKVKLLLVFSLGLFTISMSVVRLAQTVLKAHNNDFTYAYGEVDIWANLEWSVGLIVACLIVCPALWDRVFRGPLTAYWARISSACQSALSIHPERYQNRNDSHTQLTEIRKTTSIAQESETV